MIWNSFVNQIVLLPILEDWKKPVQSICHEQHLCKKIQAHIKFSIEGVKKNEYFTVRLTVSVDPNSQFLAKKCYNFCMFLGLN